MNEKVLQAGIHFGEVSEQLSDDITKLADSWVRGVSIGRAKFADDEIRNAVEVLKSYGCTTPKDFKKLLKALGVGEDTTK